MDAGALRVLERRGWSDQKVSVFRESFYEFLNNCYINSKDLGGHTCLGENLYRGQRLFIEDILTGLQRGIHDFYALKSRQLGFSTISRAFDIFYLGIHEGLQGAIVMDTDSNKKSARREIETMIMNLPAAINFPRIEEQNRDALTLQNQSTILFLQAGIRKTASSGGLGRSVGLSMAHSSEMCSWDNDEGVESFRNSLSDVNPDRLYIWESTGRGYNIWADMWAEARLDTNHKHCSFYGWWSKDSQMIPRDDPDFERYGEQKPTEREAKRISEVKERYDWQITPEQLAWIRKKMDPTAIADGDAEAEFEGNSNKTQEQPWTEDDAFQKTGASFFDTEILNNVEFQHASKDYKTYWFSPGVEFVDMQIHKAYSAKDVQFKIWEEPEVDGVYVIAADVAFGASEDNDRCAVQVLRCYADGVDQAAEYAYPLITARQFAWVIMSIAAYYAGESDRAQIYLIIELNGPGAAVWDEILSLKRMMTNSYLAPAIRERGLQDVFRNVRNFFYTRPDSLGSGKSLQWKTTPGPGPSGKIRLMERCRDFVHSGIVHLRSADTIDEMRWVTRQGDTIEAQGSKKDDRVLALAMGLRAWEDRARKILVPIRRTREADAAKKSLSIQSLASLYSKNQLQNFFNRKQGERNREITAIRRARWKGR